MRPNCYIIAGSNGAGETTFARPSQNGDEHMTAKTVKRTDRTQRAVGAMKPAVAKVIEDHTRARRPLAVWRDGKVVMIPSPEAAAVHEEPGKYRTGKKDSA